MRHVVLKCCCFFAVLLTLPIAPLLARQTPSTSGSSISTVDSSKALNDKLAQLDQRVTAAQSSADNSWMLVSAALVLLMTGPGLALFYGGLVRRKNMLAIMMQSFMLMAVISVLWALVGYSLAFCGNGSASYVHDLPTHVRDYHAGVDHGSDSGTHEVQRDRAFSDVVVLRRVCAAGSHGMGQGRITERRAGWKISMPRFCGWDCRSH